MVATDDSVSIITHQEDKALYLAVLANLNSLIFDYVCGFKIGGTDIRKHNFSQLPILPPSFYTRHCLAFISARALELVFVSSTLIPFATDLGYYGSPFTREEARRAVLRAELDAWYARAYGLSRDQLRYILDPADVKGPGYPSETFRVLKANEIRRHGEYRTARLVLDAWDRLERGELT